MTGEASVIVQIIQVLSQRATHKQVLALAIPMVLSNITVPLLGLVDAAVIGHLEHAWYLGGVALGGSMISVVFWLLGFLRMSTTGLTAQAHGANDKKNLALILIQGLLMAWGFAALFLVLHSEVAEWIFSFSDASAEVKMYGLDYFSVRAWSAPAALANFVLLGWLLGTQDARSPMWMVLITNIMNIVLDILFVIGFGWNVKGAALASVFADYSGMIFALWCVWRVWHREHLPALHTFGAKCAQGMGKFIRLNRDIFLRSLCLQAVFSFMAFQGASFGDDIVAANAVLMSFMMIISYGMDGFAYAMEAQVGKAVGANDRRDLQVSIIGSTFWGVVICVLLTLVFWCARSEMIALITTIPKVHQQALIYWPWLVAMPLISMWCFLLDGIFVGATKGKEMRNGMFVATACFFALFVLWSSWGNHALWLAMLSFMAIRGLTLALCLIYQWQRNNFFPQRHPHHES